MCDCSGEEGQNLQFADAILHYDVPFSADRIEQRIGRLDRFGRRKDFIRHRILIPADDDSSPWQAWLELLTNCFQVFNGSVQHAAGTPITLAHDQNFVAFEFAALDFAAPDRNVYAYKLEGYDVDWIQAGTRRYASYTNLPGRDYTLRVRAANADGVWSRDDLAIRLTITPPFCSTAGDFSVQENIPICIAP